MADAPWRCSAMRDGQRARRELLPHVRQVAEPLRPPGQRRRGRRLRTSPSEASAEPEAYVPRHLFEPEVVRDGDLRARAVRARGRACRPSVEDRARGGLTADRSGRPRSSRSRCSSTSRSRSSSPTGDWRVIATVMRTLLQAPSRSTVSVGRFGRRTLRSSSATVTAGIPHSPGSHIPERSSFCVA